MKQITFRVDKMDCPCEENLIRMKLQDDSSILKLEFNLAERTLNVFHNGDSEKIANELASLNLGSHLTHSKEVETLISTDEDSTQRKVLWVVLAINFGFFLIEMITGIFSKSMGLIADSLDMLADALVYGMSLLVVGAIVSRKKKVALLSGVLQILLALVGLSEVIRRFLGLEMMPNFQAMIGISMLALIANSICLWLLHRTQSKDAHMRASIIFSANDVIINVGVIVAGLLVWWFNNNIPDLIIGVIIFLIVIRGAIRILKLSR
ncbi:cation diffusion facilitator family transporter [Parabacteroides sp. PF5-9]|uniref:cation diffusion facilitator family transporter n=1 Tax=Parabacteroides sp. PF5-9 TaxID=1742404 RepID=UPI00247348B1|nr:cation diffusion facilitator family transporter [Parabacteroides sp. PF5-9]